MKLHQISHIFAFVILSFSSFAQFEYGVDRVVSSNYDFEEGSKEYVYGDNVVLRKNPSSSAEALDTLSIGSEIVIVRKMDETASLNGLDWNWYKVKVGRTSGYILAGLIALDRVKFEDITYLVTIAGYKDSEDVEYIKYKVRARVVQSNGEYYGHETRINTNSFYIKALDDRGLDGIQNMLVIHLFAEACGVDGGDIYLFNNGERLYTGISLSRVSDAGAFWYHETIIFPKDEGGSEGIVQYERELGTFMDEEMDWTKATIHRLNLHWVDGQLTPNVDEFDFEENEEE